MDKGTRTQITFGRPFLATVGCKNDAKGEKVDFWLGERHAEFGLFKNHKSFLSSLPCCGCDMVVSDGFVKLIDVYPNDPHEFDYVSIEGRG